MRALVLLVPLVGACFNPRFDAATCGDDSACPPGLVCSGGPGDACVRPGEDIPDGAPDAMPDPLGVPDAADDVVPRCDVTAPFTIKFPLIGANTPGDELGVTLSADESIAVVARRAAVGASVDLFELRRGAEGFGSWGPPKPLLMVNTDRDELAPSLSADGLALYFHLHPGGPDDSYNIYVSRRANLQVAFGPPVSVEGINSLAWEMHPYWIPGGLYFARDEGLHRRHDIDGNTVASGLDPARVNAFVPTADELAVYYSSPDSERTAAVWLATRARPNAGFTRTIRVAEIDDPEPHIDTSEHVEWISADGCRLYYLAAHPGGAGGVDIWVAARNPAP